MASQLLATSNFISQTCVQVTKAVQKWSVHYCNMWHHCSCVFI